jgi:hypothetical protein
MKYPHLFKFAISLLQAGLAFYVLYHFSFLNLVGYGILLIALQCIKNKTRK